MVGETVGSYRIERELGSGGMGAVYLARHTLLDKWAAVKMLRPRVSEEREAVDRFFTEARATTAVRHPGIVDVYDFGYHSSGSAYLVMELLEGQTLGDLICGSGRLPESLVVAIGWQVAGALAAAHREDIVHRDLKPDNIFVIDDPTAAFGVRVKILDFGIAKLTRPGSVHHTSPGELIGTPLYMSPEQCRGNRDLDGRSDVYQLGCVLYHALADRPPFVSEDPVELLQAHALEDPPPLTEVAPDASPELAALIGRALAKPAEERPGCATFAQELRQLAEVHAVGTTPPLDETVALEPPALLTSARRRLWIGAAVGGAVAAAILAVLLLGSGGDGELAAPAAEAAATPAAASEEPESAADPEPEPEPELEPEPAIESGAAAETEPAPRPRRKARRGGARAKKDKQAKKEKEWGALLD